MTAPTSTNIYIALGFVAVVLLALGVELMTRQLVSLGNNKSPNSLNGTLTFPRTLGFKILAGSISTFWSALILASLSHEDAANMIFVAPVIIVLMFGGYWLMFDKVILDNTGIHKRELLNNKGISWEEITGIHFITKKGRITITTTNRTLTIKKGFVAPQQLLQEITKRTGLTIMEDE